VVYHMHDYRSECPSFWEYLFFFCFPFCLLEYDMMRRALCGTVVVMVLVLESGILRRVMGSDFLIFLKQVVPENRD